ncbi:MAG TPA: phosphoribosylglycinamide formyltransferase [Firmicutes bacterium]|nr:phosphoribosylglycinamide formyltransferase [Bacillota bacterium]
MDKKTRIAVFVSGGGTNLQAIIDAEKSGIIKSGKTELVISDNPEAYALERAKANGIKTAVVLKNNGQSEFEKKISEILAENKIEMIILAGFMCILSADFTSKWPERIINIHPSLIPSFCGKGCYGLHVHEKALAYGVKVTGATVHFVNEIPDGGRIISQKAVYIEDGDTPETLQRRVMEQAEWILLPAAAEKVAGEIAEKGESYGHL